MKTIEAFILWVAMLALTSCGQIVFDYELDSDDNSTNVKTELVSFSAATASQSETENVARAGISSTSTDLKDRCSTMQYWIYDENYAKLIDSGVQTSTAADFGKFSVKLAIGTYHVVVVGHIQKSEMKLDEKKMLITLGDKDDRNYDTYYANLKCSVSSASKSFSIVLKRNMCSVYVISKANPANISAINVSRTYGTSFDLKTGYAPDNQSTTTGFSVLLDDDARTKSSFTVAMFIPLPSSELISSGVDITLTPKDLNDKSLNSTTLENVQAMIGRKLIYTGALWGETGAFDVSVSDEDWEVVNETY